MFTKNADYINLIAQTLQFNINTFNRYKFTVYQSFQLNYYQISTDHI